MYLPKRRQRTPKASPRAPAPHRAEFVKKTGPADCRSAYGGL